MRTIIIVLLVGIFSFSCTTLHYHAKHGKTDKLSQLIEKGEDVNTLNPSGVSALLIAIEENNVEASKILIEAGTDLNTTYQPGEKTALRLAIEKNNYEITRYLIENGANANQENSYGWTPIMTAARSADEDIIIFLIESGADIFAKTKMGRDAKRVASENGRSDIVFFFAEQEKKMQQAEN